ncbi:MAG: hypothetical protein ACRDJM_07310 [Actinomycetota bacterium]
MHSIAMSIGEAEDLDEALQIVLRQVCEHTGWPLGRIWFPTADGTSLRAGPVWHVPLERLTRFEELGRGATRRRSPAAIGSFWPLPISRRGIGTAPSR